jgi:carbohydrate-selective porin OprB
VRKILDSFHGKLLSLAVLALLAPAVAQTAEITLETTYSFNVNSHLTLQPDVQYVMSPAGDPAIDDALIVGTRVIASW